MDLWQTNGSLLKKVMASCLQSGCRSRSHLLDLQPPHWVAALGRAASSRPLCVSCSRAPGCLSAGLGAEFAAALMAALPQCPLFNQLYARETGLGEPDAAELEAVRPDDHPAGEFSVFV